MHSGETGCFFLLCFVIQSHMRFIFSCFSLCVRHPNALLDSDLFVAKGYAVCVSVFCFITVSRFSDSPRRSTCLFLSCLLILLFYFRYLASNLWRSSEDLYNSAMGRQSLGSMMTTLVDILSDLLHLLYTTSIQSYLAQTLKVPTTSMPPLYRILVTRT